MDRSSIKLFLAVVLGILAIFFIYVAVAAWNGVPISKVGYTYIRYVALFLGASLTVWIAGKFVQQYNSGWFLPIIFVGMASIFFAWIGVVSTNPREVRMFKDGRPAPRTVAQLNGEEPTPAVPASEATPPALTSVDAAKAEYDELMKKYDFPEQFRQFDETFIVSESKVNEFVAKMLASKNSKGEPIKVEDADVFKIQNYLMKEFLKRKEEKEEKATSAAPAPAAAPSTASAEPAPAEEPKPTPAAPAPDAAIVPASAGQDALAHEALYRKKCAACHSLTANAGKMKQKWMKDDAKTLELVQWMQRLAKQDRSKAFTDDEARKIAAYIRAPGAKLY